MAAASVQFEELRAQMPESDIQEVDTQEGTNLLITHSRKVIMWYALLYSRWLRF